MGIAGVPGSGKSTTAREVCAKINTMRPRLDKHHVAVVVGMDGKQRHACCWYTQMHLHDALCLPFYCSCLFHAGYHYTRQQLDQFADPDEAHARRGAYWTFDGAAFVEKMHELRVKGIRC